MDKIIQLAKEIAHLSIEIAKMKLELKELIRKRDNVVVEYSILLDDKKRENWQVERENEKDSTKSN